MNDLKTLKEVCEILGVSRRVIQGYEKKGLIHTNYKDKYGHLLYDEKTIARMVYIRFYQKMNFQLQQITQFIDKPNKEIELILQNKLSELKSDHQKQSENLKNMERVVSDFKNSIIEDLLKTIKDYQ